MKPKISRNVLPLALVALVALTGCDGSNQVASLTAADTQAAVESAAPIAAVAGDEAALAGDLVAGMMGQLVPTAASAPAPPVVTTMGGSQATGGSSSFEPSALPPAPASCPGTFSLENGVGGSCNVSDTGTVTFTFGGTVSRNGGNVEIGGTLVLAPTANQPTSGSQWSVTFEATAVGPNGTATWSATGTVTLNGTGQLVDHALNMVRTVSALGASQTVTVTLTPAQITLTMAGPRGNVLQFQLDRGAGNGTVTINGAIIATVTVAEGNCLFVDYANPNLQDGTVCQPS